MTWNPEEERKLSALRGEITEALVGLVRTGGTGSFAMISEKDRVFFRALKVSGDPDASAEELEKAAADVRAMRKRLTAPKCAGCEGAPDLTGEFRIADLEKEDRECRALKYALLDTLRAMAPSVFRAMEAGKHDPAVCEAFYRDMFLLGEDLAEEDLLQAVYGTEDLRKKMEDAYGLAVVT